MLTFCFFFILTLLKFLSCYKKQIRLSSFILFRVFVCFFFGVGTVVRNLWLTPKSPGLFSTVSAPGLRHHRVEFRDTGQSARTGRSVRASGVLMCAQTETRCCRAADLKYLLITKLLAFEHDLDVAPFKKCHTHRGEHRAQISRRGFSAFQRNMPTVQGGGEISGRTRSQTESSQFTVHAWVKRMANTNADPFESTEPHPCLLQAPLTALGGCQKVLLCLDTVEPAAPSPGGFLMEQLHNSGVAGRALGSPAYPQ